MTYATRMLDTHSRDFNLDADVLAAFIDAAGQCSHACTACADACLGEASVGELVRCIRLDQDCADVCSVAARVASRQTESDTDLVRAIVEACATACRACGDECDEHASRHDHCRICAQACRDTEQAARSLLAAMT